MVGTGPFKFEQLDARRQRHDREEPRLLERRRGGPPRRGHLQADRRGGPAPQRPAAPATSTSRRPSPRSTSRRSRRTRTSQVIDRGESCNLFHLGHEPDPQPYQEPEDPRGHRLRDQQAGPDRHVLRRPGRGGRQLDAPGDPVLQAARACRRTTPRRPRPSSPSPARRDLTLDFWYPSDVTRPYMPDPKGIFEAIASDLEAVGLHDQPEHRRPGSPDYLDAEFAGKYPMWLIGWTCDWAGPDNFLDTAFFNYVDGQAVPRVRVHQRRARQDHDARPSRRPTMRPPSSCGRRRRT